MEAPVTEIKLTYSPTGLEEDEVLAITYSIPADGSKSMNDIFGDQLNSHASTPDGQPPLVWVVPYRGGGTPEQDVYVKKFRYTAYGMGYFYHYSAVNFDPGDGGAGSVGHAGLQDGSSFWPGDNNNVLPPFDDPYVDQVAWEPWMLGAPSYLKTWEEWNNLWNTYTHPATLRDDSYGTTYHTEPRHHSLALPVVEGDPMILRLGWGDAYRQAVGVSQAEVASPYETYEDYTAAVWNGTDVSPDISDFGFGLGNSYVRIYVNGVRGVDD